MLSVLSCMYLMQISNQVLAHILRHLFYVGTYYNGTLQKETIFENEKRNGTTKIYLQDGKLKSETVYINDEAMSANVYNRDGSKTLLNKNDLNKFSR